MSGGFPMLPELCCATSYGYANNLIGQGTTLLTGNTTANQFGVWTQLGANTPYDTTHIFLQCQSYQAGVNCAGSSIQLGIGPSGSQQVYIANLQQQYASSNTSLSPCDGFSTLIPVTIKANTAIWARVANANTGAIQPGIMLVGFSSSFMGQEIAGYDCIGYANVGYGTVATAGNSTKGTYVSIISSTAEDYCGFFCKFDSGLFGSGNTSLYATTYQVDIAIGTSGSQQIIIPDIATAVPTGWGVNTLNPSPFYPIQIPKGTNIWFRASSPGLTGAPIGLTLYGAKG